MGNALSMDLRVRFRNLMGGGLNPAAAGRMLLLSPATAARWGRKVRDGDPLEPLPSVPRKGSGKPESFVSFFVELIGQDPDITPVELQAALLAAHDMRCSTGGIDALLRRHGYPACVGNTAEQFFKADRIGVHPRVCGEHGCSPGGRLVEVGSSPRVRGTRQWRRSARSFARFIPACAGNTIPGPGKPRKMLVHPRVCGEHLMLILLPPLLIGSSPRVRGTPLTSSAWTYPRRFIPACAGNTLKQIPKKII